MMLIPLVLVGIVIYAVLRSNENNTVGILSSSADPIRILNERFAKGEIDEAEYSKKKSLLQNK